jgi:hypothetical protein
MTNKILHPKLIKMKTNFTRFRGFLAYFTIPVFIFSVLACKNQTSSQDREGTDQDIEITDDRDDIIQELSEYPLPTAFDVTTTLKEAGAAYMFDLCNDVNNVDRYMTLKSKAVNLGVYGADLSYSATYNQPQETGLYLDASAKLIDDLQIASGFNETLVNRVESNIDNVDSLIIIITDSFIATYEYLVSNEQDDLSILVMAGSWIEALYITMQIWEISMNQEQIVAIITDQSSSLEKLIEVMEPIKDSDMASDIYAGLQGLQELYKEVTGQITSEQLTELHTLTGALRTSIIS